MPVTAFSSSRPTADATQTPTRGVVHKNAATPICSQPAECPPRPNSPRARLALIDDLYGQATLRKVPSQRQANDATADDQYVVHEFSLYQPGP